MLTNASLACDRINSRAVDVIRLTVNWSSFGLSALGILGNVICIALMIISSSRWRRPFSLNLFTAYACDVTFLSCAVIQCLRIERPWLLPSIPCHRLVYASHVLSFVSQWCLWAASTERYLALARPFRYSARGRARRWVKKRSVAIVIAFFLLAFTLEAWIPIFTTTDPEKPAECKYVNGTAADRWIPVFHALDAAFSYVLPGFMIFACTIGVRRVLRRYNPNHRIGSTSADGKVSSQLRRISLSGLVESSRVASERRHGGGDSSYIILSTAGRRRRERRERRILSMLLPIAVLDASLNIQNYIVRASVTVQGIEAFLASVGACLAWDIVRAISHLAYYCQFLLNVLYWLAFPYARGAPVAMRNDSGVSGLRKREATAVSLSTNMEANSRSGRSWKQSSL